MSHVRSAKIHKIRKSTSMKDNTQNGPEKSKTMSYCIQICQQVQTTELGQQQIRCAMNMWNLYNGNFWEQSPL